MSTVTITGSVGGTTISVAVSARIQQELAQRIFSLASQAGASPQLVAGAGDRVVSSSVVIDDGQAGSTIRGSTDVPEVQVLMTGLQECFVTGGTTLSTVVSGDGSQGSVVNDNPAGALVAVTGTGGNVLEGLAGANEFVTAAGGQDIMLADGAFNLVASGGDDAILVGGPTTISAAGSATDNVLLTAGTTLAFINGSVASVDTISGAANGSIFLAGTGATSVAAGTGPESFTIDTSAGNVTLNGSLSGSDMFTFVKGSDLSSATIQVANFTSADVINLQGYVGNGSLAFASTPSGGVLSLSDGSKINFGNASADAVRHALGTG